ncbi:MAG: ABC transporter permease [Lutisporaceae bacterium]
MIIINEFKRFYREKSNLVFMIGLPIVLLIILGNIFSENSLSEFENKEIKAAYIINENCQNETKVIDSFVSEVENESNISLLKASDLEAVQMKIENQELDGAMIFDRKEILYINGKDDIINKIMLSIIASYNINSNAISVTGNMTMDDSSFNDYIEENNLGNNRTIMDYYSVSILMMITFMVTIIGANCFCEEFRLKTLNRLMCSTYSRSRIFWHKFLGLVLASSLEIVVYIVITKVFFGVTFATDAIEALVIFLLAFMNSLTLLMVGVVLGLFIKKNPLPFIMPLYCIMMFLGGTFSNTLYVKGITECMPIYQLQTIIFKIGIFHQLDAALPAFLLEIAFFITLSIIAIKRFNGLEEVR